MEGMDGAMVDEVEVEVIDDILAKFRVDLLSNWDDLCTLCTREDNKRFSMIYKYKKNKNKVIVFFKADAITARNLHFCIQ